MSVILHFLLFFLAVTNWIQHEKSIERIYLVHILTLIKSNYTDHILFNLLENILMRILKMFLQFFVICTYEIPKDKF